ncbi:VOC family protein [Xylanimonas ulmi]|uniref:VOC family protein n=1 Tax=Xylanimonas ulmi TaxID=228973 RepID=UPI003BF8814D
MTRYPLIAQVVLDTTDVRGLAEFYRRLFGLEYRAGDEPPPEGRDDDADWLVLRNPAGPQLAFQQVDALARSTWPAPDVPQQLHLDSTVPDVAALDEQTERAIALGAAVRSVGRCRRAPAGARRPGRAPVLPLRGVAARRRRRAQGRRAQGRRGAGPAGGRAGGVSPAATRRPRSRRARPARRARRPGAR